MTIIYQVNYVTEREAAAIRHAFDGFGRVDEDVANMSFVFRDEMGAFSVPIDTVHRFIEDWRQCGGWALRGRRDAP